VQPDQPLSASSKSSSNGPCPATTRKLTLGEQTLTSHRLLKAFTDKYKPGDILGEGGFGFVIAAQPKCDTDASEVAVKFILKGSPVALYPL
jgi:hypothetical protein